MIKVLILAYDFPPYSSVGSQRPHSWFQHLNEYGVQPTVITRKWNLPYGNELDYIAKSNNEETEIVQSAFGIVKQVPYQPHLGNKLQLKYEGKRFSVFSKIVSVFHELFQFLLPIGNKRNIYLEAKKTLEAEKYDLIIATGDPFVLLRYASKLSRKFNIPWIADYRDPWSTKDRNKKNIFQRAFENYFERNINNSAKAIIVVSDIMKSHVLCEKKEKLVAIENGFNLQKLKNIQLKEQLSDVLTISLAGSIYDHHPIEIFLRVCNDFLKESPQHKLRIRFIGINKEDEIKELISGRFILLEKSVEFYPRMSHEDSLHLLSESNAFLLFNAFSTSGTKIYELLFLKRKIIFCFKNDEEAIELYNKYFGLKKLGHNTVNPQQDIINETKAGCIVENANELLSLLRILQKEFDEKRMISCNTNNALQQFSVQAKVKELSKLINEIISE